MSAKIIIIKRGGEDIKRATHVEDNKCAEDTQVPPTMRIENVEAGRQEGVRGAELAELARSGGVGIGEVPSEHGYVRAHVLLAGLSSGRDDLHQLFSGACNFQAAQGCDDM